MPKGKAALAFEWGSERFSTREGLADILALGYFREGRVWGSVRAGWEEVVAWDRAFEILRESVGREMRQLVGPERAPKRVPRPVADGVGHGLGDRLWISTAGRGFLAALDQLWAPCEARVLAGSAKAPAAAKAKAGANARTAAGARPEGPRRL